LSARGPPEHGEKRGRIGLNRVPVRRCVVGRPAFRDEIEGLKFPHFPEGALAASLPGFRWCSHANYAGPSSKLEPRGFSSRILASCELSW